MFHGAGSCFEALERSCPAAPVRLGQEGDGCPVPLQPSMRVRTGGTAVSTTVSACAGRTHAAAGRVTTSARTRGAALVSDCLPPCPFFICFSFCLSSCPFLSAVTLLLSPVIDYCSFGNHSCQHECVSIPNGHYCRCRSGFTLQPDGKSCRGTSWCAARHRLCV